MGAACCSGQEGYTAEYRTDLPKQDLQKKIEEYPQTPSPLHQNKSPTSNPHSPAIHNTSQEHERIEHTKKHAFNDMEHKSPNKSDELLAHFPLDYETFKLNGLPKLILESEQNLKAQISMPTFHHQYREDPDEEELPVGEPYKNPSTGDIYVGQWKGGLYHGRGKLYMLTGDIYEGHWEHGKKKGKGRILYRTGDVYEGYFELNLREGEGVYKGKESEYEGSWKDDLQHGFGKETWKDGTSYEGNFVYGVKEGNGRFQYTFGYYLGEFNNNLRHGKGKMSFSDGKFYDGQWKNDKMHGSGEFHWTDGTIYIGMYEFGNKEGYGSLIWADGKKFEGYFKNGLQDGEGSMHMAGKTRKGLWKDGKRVTWLDQE